GDLGIVQHVVAVVVVVDQFPKLLDSHPRLGGPAFLAFVPFLRFNGQFSPALRGHSGGQAASSRLPASPICSPCRTTAPNTPGKRWRYASAAVKPSGRRDMAWAPVAAASASMHEEATTTRPSAGSATGWSNWPMEVKIPWGPSSGRTTRAMGRPAGSLPGCTARRAR